MQITFLRIASAALALGLCCFEGSSAHAQAAPAVSNVAVSDSSMQLTSSNQQGDSVEPPSRHRMGWAGIGVKVGLAGMGAGKFTFQGQQGRTDSRMGLQVSVPINLGGDGFGWMLEPYFNQSSVGHDLKDSSGNVLGTDSVNLQALGIYTGPTFNIHAMDALYVGFGLGVKGAYLMNSSFQYAADLYGRVPVHATYYMSRSLALVAEVGFGYGASVFADKPQVMVDRTAHTARNLQDDPKFGLAYTWDATIGVRLP
jgi:hypothetical protein